MFLGGFLWSLLTLAAFFLALNARGGLKSLSERLRLAENQIDRLNEELRDTRMGRRQDPGTPALAAPPEPKPGTKPEEPETPRTPIILSPTGVPITGGVRGGGGAAPPGGTELPPEPPREPPSAPSSGGSLEEQLGTRWAVWAGGAALALGGLLLVRYTIEAGLIGPGVRIFLGALLAAALVAGGEWLRRGDVKLNIEALPDAHIPSVLTAAGTIVAFGTIYAAYALYDMLGASTAFVLLGATGILTMLASALHGPALAGLGLAGAFVTPMLVSTSTPKFWPLTIYLAVVTASAYLLARTRGWLWLAMAALAGGVLWGLAMCAGVAGPPSIDRLTNTDATMAQILVQLALACGFLAYEPHLGRRDDKAMPDPIAIGALAAVAFAMMVFLSGISFEYWGWLVTATLAIGMLTVAGWLTAPAATAIAIAGTIALTALSLWPGLDLPPDKSLLAPAAARLLRLPESISSFMTFGVLWTLVPAGIAGYRIWRGPLLPDVTSALYALAATVPPLLALILAYLRITQFDTSISFAFGGVVLALGFALASDRFQKADQAYSVSAYNLACGAFAAAAIAGLAFALVVSMSRGYLTIALALTALGTAYVSALRDIPLLRYVVTALGVLVVARIAWDPRIMGDGVGSTPIFNWLLAGYGIPAAAFYGSARILEKRGDDVPVRLSDGLAVGFAGLLAFFEIRHLMNGGNVFHSELRHVEAGLMTLTAMIMSYILARMNVAKANPVFDAAATLLGAASVAFAAFGLVIGANPYLTGDPVQGATIFSSLLPAYLIPGLAALFLARHARDLRPDWYIRAAGILAVSLIFLYVTLEVRHAFHGPLIGHMQGIADAENWAHSFAWLMLGIAFLGYGLYRQALEPRIASAVLIVLAALKVTIFDLAGIGGFWRAFSFICLGAVLIGIGLVYQKIVFAPQSKQEPS